MAIVPTYPGVYIEEISSGVRTIAGVATSIAAFIDSFPRGTLNKAVQIFNIGDFEREFGGLDLESEASYAIAQFFLNGGTEAWVVRIGTDSAKRANVKISSTPGGGSVLTVEAINEGQWGRNLRLKVHSTGPGATAFDLTISEYNKERVVRQETFRNLTVSNLTIAINDADSGSKLIYISDVTGIPAANGTFSGEHSPADNPVVTITSTAPTISVSVIDEAGNNTTKNAVLKFASGTVFPQVVQLSELAPLLEAAIRAAAPDKSTFANATVEVVGRRLRILAGAGNPLNRITFSNAGPDTTATILLLTGGATVNLQEYTLGNINAIANTAQLAATEIGNDGSLGATTATSAQISTALIGNKVEKKGIYALEDVDLFNLLSIPRTSIVGSGAGKLDADAARAVITVAIDYCQTRRAFLLIDTPNGIKDQQAIKNWLKNNDTLRSSYAALYFPRVLIPDPLNEFRLRSVGASGTIAGLYARTDSDRGVWKAPAGTEANLRNVARLEDVLTDAENGSLNPLAINCLRTFPVYGSISWGARTLDGADQKASEYKYVPVRRLALYIEETLFRGLKWVVFEPNDEPLWAQIRLNVGAFLNNLFRQGAFQGKTPGEAYFVKCDNETTTQNNINLGIVNIIVGFAPLKPAEFVIVKIQQIAGQIAT
ncbi:hypothetical protein A6770_22060 [Nostoc minutum NIES-26]|uniref:Tail sheath protein C-terminal domain-containing protein n=1 Tax=Nostoc minutum NIES-26 TaxID=1844469 RepID=A0A367QZP3_9NOSO|nr:hypothetical protein A6770_22060 [Nostoc minutum NIES-26]